MAVCGITDVCPNLPPQQPADHQVQIRGEIGLARKLIDEAVRREGLLVQARRERAAEAGVPQPLRGLHRRCPVVHQVPTNKLFQRITDGSMTQDV